jgi:hypothetical protein
LKAIERKVFKLRYNSLFLLFCALLFVGILQVVIEVDRVEPIFYIVFTRLIPEAIFNTAVGFVILYFIKRCKR